MDIYTKSIIQQQIEREDIQEACCDSLNNLMEKYNIEDAVFNFNSRTVTESVKGYFVCENEYDSLKAATADFGRAIRIQDNKIFTTGTVYESLSQCPKDKKILDLDTLQYVG